MDIKIRFESPPPPSGEQYTNIKVYRVKDKIPLPSKLLLKNKSHLYRLYVKNRLSKREIARVLNVNHSSVIERLREFGIYRPEENPSKRNKIKRQIPYGYDYKNNKLVKNPQEQEVIREIKQMRATGLSLREIANELNKKLIPTKNNGIWQANTIRKILQRGKNNLT